MFGLHLPTTENFENCLGKLSGTIEKSDCVGGFAELATLIQSEKGKQPNKTFLVFNTGNNFAGSSNLDMLHHTETATLIHLLRFTAISLGIYDFENGPKALAKYLRLLNVPVVCSNINISSQSSLAKLPKKQKIKKNVIINVKNTKIGIIAYLTPNITRYAKTFGVSFESEISSVQEETKRLLKAGVHMIIALSHSNFEIDKRVAEAAPEISIILGHKNTPEFKNLFFKTPKIDPSDHFYHYIIKHTKLSKRTLMSYSFDYVKFMTKTNVIFFHGSINTFSVETIKIKNSEFASLNRTTSAKMIDDFIRSSWKREKRNLSNKFAVMKINLSSKNCDKMYCTLATLVLNAINHYNQMHYHGKFWTDTTITVIESSILKQDLITDKNYRISIAALLDSISRNNIFKVRIKGHDLINAIRMSLNESLKNENPSMLHFFGLKIKYDFDKPLEKNPVNVKHLCSACKAQNYYNIHPNDSIVIMITDSLLYNANNPYYKIFGNLTWEMKYFGVTTIVCVTDYLLKIGFIIIEHEDNISFIKDDQRLKNEEFLELRSNHNLFSDEPKISMNYYVFFFCILVKWIIKY